MAFSAFTKGAAVGAASVLLLGGLAVVAAVFVAAPRDELPEPTATRHEAVGTVTETEPVLCVEGAGDAQEAPPTLRCGLVQPGLLGASNLTVGDAVVGTIIEVETDPGSGAAFAVWESLAAA